MSTKMDRGSPEAGIRLHFKNAPIIEAVIAISIAPLPASALEAFRSTSDEMIASGYRSPEFLTQHQLQMRIESGVSRTDTQDQAIGLKFLSEDGLHAVQFTRSAFVFSRIGAYDCWEQFRDEAKKLWKIYSQLPNVGEPTALGVRYINKLFIPDNANPEDYVCAFPKFPDNLSPLISDMFMRLGVPIREFSGKLVHTQALLPQERKGFSTLLFDNDFQFPVEGKTAEHVWAMLEQVREIKNRYFVELTTSKMREAFDA